MLKLSISNISWDSKYDQEIYKYLFDNNIQGLEIAPTRVFPNNPYEYVKEAHDFKEYLSKSYHLKISSMQSIWYGKTEKMFQSVKERKLLMEYTKKAIDFAAALECHNLVFGCPKNRSINCSGDYNIAVDFFSAIGEYAHNRNTVIALEANPVIYNTNFITSTAEAFSMVKEVQSEGFLVNLDIGTMIYNEEPLDIIADNIDLINHIHISEPGLAGIQKRKLHRQLAGILAGQYSKFISIEMGKQEDLQRVFDALSYVKEVFYEI